MKHQRQRKDGTIEYRMEGHMVNVSMSGSPVSLRIQLFTLPFTIMTLGLFTLVVNGIVLNLAFAFVSGAHCNSLITCIGASIVLSILNTGLHAIFDDK